jgi:hypothetical protein
MLTTIKLLFIVSFFFVASAFAQEYSDSSDYAEYYIVRVAEGKDYNALKKIEIKTAKKAQLKINEETRIYKPAVGIVLPDKCNDDLYCGEYYPRRPFGDRPHLSIEMKYAFWDTIDEDPDQMIIVAGIFELENKEKAKELTAKLNKLGFSFATYYKTKLYLGCMH